LNGAIKNETYKSLYLLHGLSDDQTIWIRRTSIERYANEYGICVIMPFGGRYYGGLFDDNRLQSICL
jgi:S-formylglutathione hydrolase FrmB